MPASKASWIHFLTSRILGLLHCQQDDVWKPLTYDCPHLRSKIVWHVTPNATNATCNVEVSYPGRCRPTCEVHCMNPQSTSTSGSIACPILLQSCQTVTALWIFWQNITSVLDRFLSGSRSEKTIGNRHFVEAGLNQTAQLIIENLAMPCSTGLKLAMCRNLWSPGQ